MHVLPCFEQRKRRWIIRAATCKQRIGAISVSDDLGRAHADRRPMTHLDAGGQMPDRRNVLATQDCIDRRCKRWVIDAYCRRSQSMLAVPTGVLAVFSNTASVVFCSACAARIDIVISAPSQRRKMSGSGRNRLGNCLEQPVANHGFCSERPMSNRRVFHRMASKSTILRMLLPCAAAM